MGFPGPAATRDLLKKYQNRSFLTIDCGDWTYGEPKLSVEELDSPRRLTIGRYCSIAEEVTIFVGRHGRHATDTLTTYPLGMAIDAATQREDVAALDGKSPIPSKLSYTNLDVEIGNDVWLGLRCIVMAGVKIGDGAIIGAGAVVTKDVKPYAVVIGAPAKVIRFRHEPHIVERLLQSRWWELEPDEIWSKLGSLAWSSEMDKVASRLPQQTTSEPVTLVGSTPEELLALFEDRSRSINRTYPIWPPTAVQLQFTGGSGMDLLDRSLAFLQQMELDGAFSDPVWRALDFGCGWGRLASVMLLYGSSDKLDLCDAWDDALTHIRSHGFKNKSWRTNEMLSAEDLPNAAYDFVYAFSIFTHLSRPVFENNVARLMHALKPGGRFYFTVRHEDYLEPMKLNYSFTEEQLQNGDQDGFLHVPYPGRPNYGETIIRREFLEAFSRQSGFVLKPLGMKEPLQHVYSLQRA